jgi:tetratricopeptide (TPR) repeat protein
MDRAVALDPYNLFIRATNGHVLNIERRYAESIEELQAVLRIQPDHPLAVANLRGAYHQSGKHDEALAMLRRQVRVQFPGDQELEESLDQGYAEGGYRAALLRYAEALAARPEAPERLSMDVAHTYASAGEKERALDWLETAYEARALGLPIVGSGGKFSDLLGDDPRFHDLLRRMNLPIGPEGN